MKITNQTVVRLSYVLHVEKKIVEQTPPDESRTVLMARPHELPAGLAALLLGHETGDTFGAAVPPEEGYGRYDPAKRYVVSVAAFPEKTELIVGAQVYTRDGSGKPQTFRVVDRDGDAVTVDANHQLAGETLEYHVTVHHVRVADLTELAHGHVHGEGGVFH